MPSLIELPEMTKVYLHVAERPTVAVGLVTLAAYILLETIYNLFFHPLRNIPGPFFAKLGQSWRNYKYFRGTWHDDCLKLHNQYGNVVRIAPNEISFVDEQGLESLYSHGRRVVKVFCIHYGLLGCQSQLMSAKTDLKLCNYRPTGTIRGRYQTCLSASLPLLT